MKRSFKILVLALAFLAGSFSLVFSHMLWIEKLNGEYKVFWGHAGKVEHYDPKRVKMIKAFDKKEKELKIEKKVVDNFLILASNKKPSLMLAFMDGVYLVTTPEGKKRMDKIEAQKQGLQVVESFYVIQATKAVFSDSSVLKKPLKILKLDPVFVEGPFDKKDTVIVKVFYEGKSAEGVTIFNAFHKELAKTDSQGLAKLSVEELKMKEGHYALVAFYKVKISDPKADYLWLITSLTWQK